MLYNFTIPYFVYGTPNNTLQTLHYGYIFTSKKESVAYFCDSYSIIASIGQFRILTVGLDLAWNGGWCGQINLHLKRFARISLHFMLDPVQPWEFENGVLNAPLVYYGRSWWHERPKKKIWFAKTFQSWPGPWCWKRGQTMIWSQKLETIVAKHWAFLLYEFFSVVLFCFNHTRVKLSSALSQQSWKHEWSK